MAIKAFLKKAYKMIKPNAIKHQYGKEDFQFEFTCPRCKSILDYYDDYGQEYMYCSKCSDVAYNMDGTVGSYFVDYPEDR